MSDSEKYFPAREAEFVEKHFKNGFGLCSDIRNRWQGLRVGAQGSTLRDDFKEFITPLEHYEDYAKKSYFTEAILKHSDQEAVRKYDEIVNKFNADLPRIIRENDGQAIQNFLKTAEELISSPEAIK
ncbi:MAG: hypothetical protein HZC05_02085 [Candidatus Magasanikbacteria bacterium]|nr:hypothetical protein [Candidatus Magasanikbacteria bacterium]